MFHDQLLNNCTKREREFFDSLQCFWPAFCLLFWTFRWKKRKSSWNVIEDGYTRKTFLFRTRYVLLCSLPNSSCKNWIKINRIHTKASGSSNTDNFQFINRIQRDRKNLNLKPFNVLKVNTWNWIDIRFLRWVSDLARVRPCSPTCDISP